MQVARSLSFSPAFNFALEKRLFLQEQVEVLLLYINSPAVIVGRNQCIRAEVDTAYCEREGIEVHQRISGGGTVYHDRGNINYAFITSCGSLPLLDSSPVTPIVEALRSLGADAQVGSRGEVLVGGMKVSGTASHIARRRQLFHGTLLHSADLKTMERALRGEAAVRGKKIASVSSPVANLSSVARIENNAEGFMQQLIDFFLQYYKCHAGAQEYTES